MIRCAFFLLALIVLAMSAPSLNLECVSKVQDTGEIKSEIERNSERARGWIYIIVVPAQVGGGTA